MSASVIVLVIEDDQLIQALVEDALSEGEEWASKGVPNSLLLAKPFAPAQIVTAVSQLINASLPTSPTE